MKSLILLTTYKCNMNCGFCIFYDRLNTDSIEVGLLSNVLKQAGKLGFDLIALTGGEPCLHPEFNKLIKVIVDNDFPFGIASNGYSYEKYISLLKYKDKFNYITFSLDSHKEEVHDRLRRKGSYKRTIEAIKYFSKKTDVKISICLNRENYKDIEEYILFLDSFGIKDIRFLSVIPTPKNKIFVLTDQQREACCDIINRLRDKVNINLRIMSSLSTDKGVDFCSVLNLSVLTINPKGELIFCCDIREKGAVTGSLLSSKLEDLIEECQNISDYLKNKRKYCLDNNKNFQGFNTCTFCTTYLRK